MRAILAASDLADVNEEGIRAAARIAARTGAALHAVHGAGAVGLSLREAMPHLEPGAQARLRERLRERVAAGCRPFGVEAAEHHVSCHETIEALPASARSLETDLVVIGSASLRTPTGLVALARLRRGVSCPVLIARPGAAPPYRSVLVPLSAGDLRAGTLHRVCEWLAPLCESGPSLRCRTDIHVLHVARGLREWREAGAALEQALREAEALLWGMGRPQEHVRWAEAPAARILETAAYEEADLIVLGPGRAGGPAGRPRTWETIASEARCGVLLMPRGHVPLPPAEAMGATDPADIRTATAS